jgi:hypothetical protein
MNHFNKVYGEILGCETDVLFLLNGGTSQIEIQDKILSADNYQYTKKTVKQCGEIRTLHKAVKTLWLSAERKEN